MYKNLDAHPEQPPQAAPAAASKQADTLTLAFSLGVSPSKWVNRWQQGGYTPRLLPQALPLEFFTQTDAALTNTLLSGGVALVRLSTSARPETIANEPLHAVCLYTEGVALLLAKDTPEAQLGTISEMAEFELFTLLDHPWHLQSYPPAVPWTDPAWVPDSAAAIAELTATGAGAALLPLPLARQLARKKQHRVLAVTPELELPQTQIWAVWLQRCDNSAVQNLVGVLRGRLAGSGRTVENQQVSTVAPGTVRSNTAQSRGTQNSRTQGGKTGSGSARKAVKQRKTVAGKTGSKRGVSGTSQKKSGRRKHRR